jgi:hypothetical protein
MATTFRNLRNAMSAQATGGEPTWSDLIAELVPAISRPLTWETEELLLEVLRFEGRLRLTVSADLPHSMPPEDMLKSLAVQALVKWAGLSYTQEIERVQATTQSSSLSSLIRDVIQKARQETKHREAKEEVAVSSPREAMKTVPRRLVKERGMWRLRGVRVRAGSRDRELAGC